MQFYLFAATAFSLLASVHAAADLTAEALAMGIDELSGLSNKTDILLQPMTADNVTAVMPEVVTNLQGIVVTGLEYAVKLTESQNSTMPSDAQPAVCDSLANFTTTHEALLDTLIKKAELAAGSPFPAPLAGVMQSVKAVVDGLAAAVIALLPSCKEDANTALKALDTKFDNAVKAFSA